MKKALLLAAIMLSAIPAFAAHWTRIGALTDDSPIEIDMSGAVSTAGPTWHTVTVWTRTTFINDDKASPGHSKGVKIQRIHWKFLCVARQAAIISLFDADAGGNSVNSFTYDNPEWADVPPDSTKETILETACAKK